MVTIMCEKCGMPFGMVESGGWDKVKEIMLKNPEAVFYCEDCWEKEELDDIKQMEGVDEDDEV